MICSDSTPNITMSSPALMSNPELLAGDTEPPTAVAAPSTPAMLDPKKHVRISLLSQSLSNQARATTPAYPSSSTPAISSGAATSLTKSSPALPTSLSKLALSSTSSSTGSSPATSPKPSTTKSTSFITSDFKALPAMSLATPRSPMVGGSPPTAPTAVALAKPVALNEDGVLLHVPGLPDAFPWQLPGENVVLECPNVLLLPEVSYLPTIQGSLVITNYQLVFIPGEQTFSSHAIEPIFIPVRCIDAVTKIGRKFFSGPTHYSMSMQCKDLRSYRFAFDQDLHPRRQVFQYLQQLAFGDPMQVFAFSYADVNLLAASQMRPLYDPVAEFRRMGVFTGSHYVDGVSRGWCLTTINRDYSLCPSYPSVLVKPQYISQDLLLTAAAFRCKARIPTLTWRNKRTGAVICRSSQPRVGMAGARCIEDEMLIRAIRDSARYSGDANTPDIEPTASNAFHPLRQSLKRKILYIYDARPLGNAVYNQVAGHGYEMPQNYDHCKVFFLSIENLHAVRKCFFKLRELCLSSNEVDPKWPQLLHGTGWLVHISAILTAAQVVSRKIRKGESTLIHCSDGWDRTAQLCSLCEVLLDGFYRSIAGFIVLIEKEWLSFGHKFMDRASDDMNEKGPIFLQFLDCVWQLQQQLPQYFEYNEAFLVELAHHSNSARFGTFLFNCEQERAAHRVANHTVSYWAYVEAHRERFTNPDYKANMLPNGPGDEVEGLSEVILYPSTSIDSLRFWSTFYPHAPIYI